MPIKTNNTQLFIRSAALGVLVSMLSFYLLYVLGKWSMQNQRPDPGTTASLVIYNTCAVLEHTHQLRPADKKATLTDGVDALKLAVSLMIFLDGHIVALIIFAIVSGVILFLLRRKSMSN